MTCYICITPWYCGVVRISTVVMVSIVIGIIIVFIIPDNTRMSCSCRIYISVVVCSIIDSIDAINIWKGQTLDVQYRTLLHKALILLFFLLARSNTRDIPFSNILISKKQFMCNKKSYCTLVKNQWMKLLSPSRLVSTHTLYPQKGKKFPKIQNTTITKHRRFASS